MGSFSVTHWVILLVVVLLVFGTKKLKGAGKDLGGAVKGFKDALSEDTPQENPKITVQANSQSDPQKSDHQKNNQNSIDTVGMNAEQQGS